jgi:hypothetical protein
MLAYPADIDGLKGLEKHALARGLNRIKPLGPLLPKNFNSDTAADRLAAGLGRLLASAMLRDRGKTRAHLRCLAEGARAVPREHRRSRDATTRLVAELDSIASAAKVGLKQHDRWLLARELLLRKLGGRRSTSKLPELIEFLVSRPLVSAGMIAKAIGVTPRAPQNLVAELGLREATGRGRYRAWGSCSGNAPGYRRGDPRPQ